MTATVYSYSWFMYYYEQFEHRRWGWPKISSIAFITGDFEKDLALSWTDNNAS